jgi:hypothetical protein
MPPTSLMQAGVPLPPLYAYACCAGSNTLLLKSSCSVWHAATVAPVVS